MIYVLFGKTAQSAQTLYCLIFAYEEPEPGLHRLYASLTPQEFKKVQYILMWLNEHGDGGNYLASWQIQPAGEEPTQLLDYASLIEEIKLQSRYNETDKPGDFYGGTNPFML